jgi:DNA mismatch endonuclease (patch repair protein)
VPLGRDARSPERSELLMVDSLTTGQRSALMSRIGPRDTKPEKIVRSCLHRLGLRFRLHNIKLPGTPDIVLPKHHTAIFVHGCFWHRHAGCKSSTTPKTRVSFWAAKFLANVRRDRSVRRKLRAAGWDVVIVWECETKNVLQLNRTLKKRLPFIS